MAGQEYLHMDFTIYMHKKILKSITKDIYMGKKKVVHLNFL